MKRFKKPLLKGILSILGLGVFILTLFVPSYGGEFKPVVPGITKQGTLEIKIKNLDFTESENGMITDHLLVIPRGVEVQWVNVDPFITNTHKSILMPHGIRVSNEMEKVMAQSSILEEGRDTFSYLFKEKGTYKYSCYIHPFLKGRIVVIERPSHVGS